MHSKHVNVAESLKIIDYLGVKHAPIDDCNYEIHEKTGLKADVVDCEKQLFILDVGVERTPQRAYDEKRCYFQGPVRQHVEETPRGETQQMAHELAETQEQGQTSEGKLSELGLACPESFGLLLKIDDLGS